MMTPQKQGYIFIAITMCIWGGIYLNGAAQCQLGHWCVGYYRLTLSLGVLHLNANLDL